METKVNVSKELDSLSKRMSKSEVMAALHRKGDEVTFVIDGKDADEQIAALLAIFIESYFDGDYDEGRERLAKIILNAIKLLPPYSYFKTIEYICSQPDEDETEECKICNYLMTCNDKRAVEFRKAHGIPKPRKKH